TSLVAWGAAVLVIRTAPHRPVNRRLFALLVLEGIFSGAGFGLLFLIDHAGAAFALGTVSAAAMIALPFHYLSFLGASLKTPLVAPFVGRPAVIGLTALSLAAAGWVLIAPELFITQPYHPDWATWNFRFRDLGQRGAQLHGVGYIFGLIAALSAFRRTRPGSAARSRAKWFAIAFGARDGSIGIMQLLYPVIRPVPFWGDFLYNPVQGLVFFGYVLLLVYGVLRTQLFDIELKIKFALKHSTVAAAIAGGFFIGSEALETVVPVDSPLLSVLAAAAIVAALRPIQRLAERFTNRVMRGVEDSPRYLGARKLEVYQAALEGAIEDGVITERERTILVRLRDQLEIPTVEADRMERDVVDRARVASE
ncbi:MAG: hypothetical protein ACODAE_04300, partial [Gemmatimonadota bacterium]